MFQMVGNRIPKALLCILYRRMGEEFLFRALVQAVLRNNGESDDTLGWSGEAWADAKIQCGDLSSTSLFEDIYDEETGEWYNDDWDDEYDLAERNILDGLRFLGLIRPTGKEEWAKGGYKKAEGEYYQKYADDVEDAQPS
jgi:hypothetical protein